MPYDQPCGHGDRIDGAVRCRNPSGAAPRKCRRTWLTQGRIRDESCPGFEANPSYIPRNDLLPEDPISEQDRHLERLVWTDPNAW